MRRYCGILPAVILLIVSTGHSSERQRVRDAGIAPGILAPGALNAITDVAGVKVGHRTLIEGEDVRTGVTVVQPDGGSRQVTWTNTNAFIGREGFDGIKTGTTRLAGACLLSTAWRGDDRLFMVVLGTSSRNRRYIDSEALYEWAWGRFTKQAAP